jgi:2-haloacid dehalogenase
VTARAETTGGGIGRPAYHRDALATLSAALLGLAPGQCMMLAAHNGDLAAASTVGFRTAFVPRPAE